MDQMCVWWCAGMCITILLSLCVFTDVYCISPLIDIIKCNITYWKTMMCRDTSCCAACVLYRYIYILYSVTYFETNFICKYQSHDCHVTRWLLHPPTDRLHWTEGNLFINFWTYIQWYGSCHSFYKYWLLKLCEHLVFQLIGYLKELIKLKC